jgi:DnaJ-domain-containing protein 1
MGVAFLTYEDNAYTGSGYDDHYRNSYSDYSYDSDYTDDSAHDTYEEEHYTSSYQQQSSLQTYYDILGCSPEDDFSTIKKAYKKLSMKFHPDAIEGKGLDSEFIKFATEKMKEINEAYMKIKAVKYAT